MNLIAAAPELLYAVRALLSDMEMHGLNTLAMQDAILVLHKALNIQL